MFDEYFRLKGFGHILRKFRRTGPIMKFTAQQIREHDSSPEAPRPDFLTRFIQARDKYPHLMTDLRLATYTNTNVSAGSDTTAIALRQIVYKLLTHPGARDRFLAELAAVLRARKDTGEGFERPITWAEGQGMAYYQALIKECLRTHAPLGQLIPRVVPEGGTMLHRRFIPAGTVVGCNAWVVHRDKSVFGDDADKFRPERWLDGDGDGDRERRRNMENLSFAFGSGPRVCLGKSIALLEISKMVPELFRRYEVGIVDANRYKLRPGWLVVQSGLDVTLKTKKEDWWMTYGT